MLQQKKVIRKLGQGESLQSLAALCNIPKVSYFFHKLELLMEKHCDTIGRPPPTDLSLLVGALLTPLSALL